MKRKRIFFFNSNQANYCVWVFCAGGKSFHQNLRIGGSWGWEIQNQPVPPPSDITSFLPFRNKKTKTKRGRGKDKKEKDHTGNIHSFRKQFYVTYKWKKKGWGGGVGRGGGGVNTIQIPNTQYFTSWWCISITIKLQSPLFLSPSCPSHPSMHRYSAWSLGTAPPLTAVRAAGVLGQETGEGISARGRGRLYVETVCGRSDEPPSSVCQQCWGGGAWSRMLVCPPVVAVVCRLVDLRLLLNGGVLAALSSAALWREERVYPCDIQDIQTDT